jgi:HSP20 family protein
MAKEERSGQMTPVRRSESGGRLDVWREPWTAPLAMMQRLSDEMDRMFGDWGRRPWRSARFGELQAWSPAIEVSQRENELVVRADLPGLKKEDVNVEVSDDAITINGERRHEEKEEREGYFRSERSYGSFSRVIPLPEGAITESAKAKFKDGVLEITMQVPPKETRKTRKLELS